MERLKAEKEALKKHQEEAKKKMEEEKNKAPKQPEPTPIAGPPPLAKTIEDVDDSLVPSDQPFAMPYKFSMLQMDMITGNIT